MTTGSYTGYPSCYSTPGGQNASWSGNDGKYETVSGRTRLRWNAYSKTFRHKFSFVPPGAPNGTCIDWTPVHQWSGDSDRKLLSRLTASAKDHSFNLAVAVAEGKQTISLLKSTLATIGQAALDLKRGKLSAVSQLIRGSRRKPSTKDIADRWIELQYGWKPLYNDVFESAKAFEAVTAPARADVIKVSATQKDHFSYSSSPSNWMGMGPRKTRTIIWFERQESLSAARSLGLINPASVLWELTPWSFAIDWFIPVGTYLDNLSIIPNLVGRFMRSQRTDWHPVYRAINPSYAGNIVKYYCWRVDRTIPSAISVPRPSFKTWPQALSPQHVWNAIALARGKVGTGPSTF